MATRQTQFLILVILLILAFLLLQGGFVFFALMAVVVAILTFIALAPFPKRQPIHSAVPVARKEHPPYPKAQEHINRHTQGFGAALDNLGRAIIRLAGFFGIASKPKPKH